MKIARLAIVLLALQAYAAAKPVRDHRVVAELVPTTDAIVPGETLTICLDLHHDTTWHTYWKNPGILGVPITLKWEMPEGFEVGETRWARPQRVKMAGNNTYGYEGHVTLLYDIKTPANLELGKTISLKATPTWMMCTNKNTCHWSPANVTLPLKIPVAEKAAPHPRGDQLAKATLATMPVENQDWDTAGTLTKKTVTLILTRKPGSEANPNPEDLYFFSDDGLIHSDLEQTVTRESPGVYKLVMPRMDLDVGPKNPTGFSGVLMDMKNPDADALIIHAKFPDTPKQRKKKKEKKQAKKKQKAE